MIINQHHMEHIRDTQDGGEVWECPDCGRKLIAWWEPFRRIVLVRGDNSAQHDVSTGGVHFAGMDERDNDPYLEPFEKFLNGRG